MHIHIDRIENKNRNEEIETLPDIDFQFLHHNLVGLLYTFSSLDDSTGSLALKENSTKLEASLIKTLNNTKKIDFYKFYAQYTLFSDSLPTCCKV